MLLYFLSLLKNVFVYYFSLHWVSVAVCGLSLVAMSRGHSLVAVCGLLRAVASLCLRSGALDTLGLRSCGSWA